MTAGVVARAWSSRDDLVAQPAIGERARKVHRVEPLREPEFYRAGRVEDLHLVGWKLQVEAGEVVLKLRELARADDRDHGDRPVAEPRQRDLGHRSADLIGDGLERRDDALRTIRVGQEFLHHVAGKASLLAAAP